MISCCAEASEAIANIEPVLCFGSEAGKWNVDTPGPTRPLLHKSDRQGRIPYRQPTLCSITEAGKWDVDTT